MIAFKGGRMSAGGKRSGLGSGFGSLVSYLRHGKAASPSNPERVAWVSYRNLDGIDDPRQAARIMRAYAEENPRVERPVYHFGLSLSSGEHLTPQEWEAAVDRVLARMGLAERQALVIAHGDTDREHVHIVVNRVGEDGRAWDPRRDLVKAYEAVHEIEDEHGLRRTGEPALDQPDLSPGVHQQARRTGEQPLADRVREEAGPDLARATSWRDLDERLAALGFRLESAKRGSGVVVTDGRHHAALSHVDRSLSGPKLARRFGETFPEYREHHPEPPLFSPEAAARWVEAPIGERAEALIQGVSATRATFTETDLLRAAFYEPDREALVGEALRPENSVEIGMDRGIPRYSTREYLKAEERLFFSAERLAGRAELRLEAAGVERVIERTGARLSPEQRAAVLHATTDDDLSQIVGRAGAGKTTVARTIAEAYREQGYEVRGAALAGKAAEGLEQESGIPSRTLASLERAWNEGRDRLDAKTVLVVDEAGMIDTRHLGRVLHEADQHGAKVVLLGDPDQLKAIGAGDAYRGLLGRHEQAALETIRRQAEPWQRRASEELAAGRITPALDRYEEAGRLHWTETRDEARAQLVARYLEDRRTAPEASRLIVTYRNEDVRQLNEAVRDGRRAAGELAGPGVSVGRADYASGDRIVFLKNDNPGREVANLDGSTSTVGVKNGTLGTVEVAEPGRFVARLDDGRRVAFDPARYDSIAHGYAVTIHKSQGATVDRVYALADPSMNRHATYVALTRHREAVDLYADQKSFEQRDRLDTILSRPSRKDLAQDYGTADLSRLAARARSYDDLEKALRREEQSLKAELVTLERVTTARRELAVAHHGVAQAAARVYFDPQEATRTLLADPKAFDRLAAGEVSAYGRLHGEQKFLFGKDARRTRAEQEVPHLRAALWRYAETAERLSREQSTAARIGDHLPEVKALLDRVTSTLSRPVERLWRGPEQAVHTLQSLPSRLVPRTEAQRGREESARFAVQAAAARVYMDPYEATRALLADPKSPERLAAGKTTAYGELDPRARVVGSDGRARADHELPALSAAIRVYRETEHGVSRRPGAVAAVGSGALEVKALLDRVTSTLRQVEVLSRGPEQALELAVRQASRTAVHTALSLLPSPIQTPVRLAVRATELALGLGRDLGL